ncbi:MAG: hypothetical protein ACOYNU_13445, partial [Bacteroidales bacterium]
NPDVGCVETHRSFLSVRYDFLLTHSKIKPLANVHLHEYVTAHTGVFDMPKNATITLRIEEELKADSEQTFRRPGLTTTEAIKIPARRMP